ncbi:hypothetical protein ACTQZS_14125 [Bilifractor sp. LCP19S3_H10]|uniref:hypothetical protein n=1 Tax=Bilifractor sp. LCP19S3_H10 TaxID=3438736 RepID=UPI003F8E387C
MKNFNISDLRKVASDPKALEAIKKASPQFANISAEDFQKIVAGAEDHLEKFEDKYGNLTLGEILHMHPLRYEDLHSYTLRDFTEKLIRINDIDIINLIEILNNGDGLVTTKNIGKSDGFRYVFVRKNHMLYLYSLKDTTNTTVVLSLAYVLPFTKETLVNFIMPEFQNCNKIFKVPERLITDAEKIVCTNCSADKSAHIWNRLTADIEKYFEYIFQEDPKSILKTEVEPMAK